MPHAHRKLVGSLLESKFFASAQGASQSGLQLNLVPNVRILSGIVKHATRPRRAVKASEGSKQVSGVPHVR